MKCPTCGREANKRYKGYCSKVHLKLSKKRPNKIKVPCRSCGKILLRNKSQIAPSGNAFCTNCGKNRGEFHSRWREGQYINPDGYRIILKDGCYQREHRLVWESANKACLINGATIHHIDYDKLNNSPDNLLLLSGEEHGRIHRFIDANRSEEAATLLRLAADRQLHYPKELDQFLEKLLA